MNENYVPQMISISEAVKTKPRIVQCIQAHNEAEFIQLTMGSIYDKVDKIIVIEGAVKNRPNKTEEGLSTDGTTELINEFKKKNDPDNKITVIRIKKPWENLEAIKQTFLDISVPGDWLLINDADEFYMPEDIDRLRLAIDRNPHATEFVPLFLHFYRDFFHVAVPGPEWQPLHQRFFKYQKGMKYAAHPTVYDAFNRDTYFSPEYWSRRFFMNNFFIYHYGYARSNMNEIMQSKKDYYDKELRAHGNAHEKFDKKVKDWVDCVEPVAYYSGEHPQALRGHPLWGKLASEYSDDKFPVPQWSDLPPYREALENQKFGTMWLNQTGQAAPNVPFFHNQVNI